MYRAAGMTNRPIADPRPIAVVMVVVAGRSRSIGLEMRAGRNVRLSGSRRFSVLQTTFYNCRN